MAYVETTTVSTDHCIVLVEFENNIDIDYMTGINQSTASKDSRVNYSFTTILYNRLNFFKYRFDQ